MSYEVHCYLCETDITDKNKVISSFMFDNDFDYESKKSEKLNYAMCSKCADKDFKLKCDYAERMSHGNFKKLEERVIRLEGRNIIERIFNKDIRRKV